MSGSERDSWDEDPGVPSHASSPVGSQHGSESGDTHTEVNEEKIMSEFRELYRSTATYNYSTTESYTELESSYEDVEKLKERLHSLKRYVFELKESYDELLKAFSLLETGAKQRVGDLERQLAHKITQAKEAFAHVESLQTQIREADTQTAQVQEMNTQLTAENSQLAGENSRLLQRVREGEITGEDLGHLLQIVSDGVAEGNLKLSKLALQSQSPPFPTQDLVVGDSSILETSTHTPIQEHSTFSIQESPQREALSSMESELASLREQLETRLSELQRLKDELVTVRAEGEASADALGQSTRELEATKEERNQLQVQLSEARENVSGLQDEVSSLTQQLREALEKQTSLTQALQDTREAMELYQTTAKQEVEHRDQELAQLTVELSTLEKRRLSLEKQVADSHTQVTSLETAHQQAHDEITSLQDEVQRLEEAVHDSSLEEEGLQETLAEKGVELEAVKEEKNELEKQLGEKVKELQAQISETQALRQEGADHVSEYQSQLSTLQALHSQCRGEADELKDLLQSRETELSRMLTTLQVAAAQIAALDGGGVTTPTTVSEKLSECEGACQALEAELAEHRRKWEESVMISEQHKTAIEDLTTRQGELEEEIAKREERVAELEALLAEVNSSRSAMSQTVDEYEESLAKVREELESTRAQYHKTCEEMSALKDELAGSNGALEEKEQLLLAEVQKRDALIETLETEEQALKDHCQECTEHAQIAEKARDALQQEYDRVAVELVGRVREVDELEKRVEGVGARGREELEKFKHVIEELKAQLQESQDKYQASQEQALHTRDELDSLQQEHAHLTEQLALREKVLRQLQEETGLLKQQHQEALDDVTREQELVETLQEELASSQGMSDGLQHEVSECEREIQELQESLCDSEQQRATLQEQNESLEQELAALQEALSAEQQHNTSLVKSSESALHVVHEEVGGLKATLGRAKSQNDLLDKTVEEQRAELVELRLKVSDLELHKESLLFQSSTNESTITSLRGQLSTVESALQDAEGKCVGLEQDFISSQTQCNIVGSQLAAANEALEDMVRSKALLEGVGSERLNEITSLHRQLEEERVREGLVRELGDQIASLEKQLTSLQNKHDVANTRALEADRACVAMETINTTQQRLIFQMENELAEVKGQLAESEGFHDQIEDLEEQLARLHTELEIKADECLSLQAQSRSALEKESHWCKELATTTAQLHLAEERVGQLEREGRSREGRVRELEGRLEAALKLGAVRQEEVSDSKGLVNELQKQVSDKQQDILHLQHLLDCCRGDLDTVRTQLSSSEDSRRGLLQRQVVLEERVDTLTREQSATEVELAGARANLAKHRAEQATRASPDDKSNRIRELEASISSLRSTNQQLEHQNQELHSQIAIADPLSSRDSSATSLTGQPSITRLRAQVDVDISSGSAEVIATTTSIPLTFDSKYRATMEKGLSATSVEGPPRYGGSETESEAAALGKDYWVKRAGELSVQLQQSSEYWTQKVRELSIELEKCKQAHRH